MIKLNEGDATEFHNYLRVLAAKAITEPWRANDPDAKEYTEEYSILKSYVRYTLNKIREENKIIVSESKDFASFNTGLVTKYYEDIYAIYKKSKSSENYFLKGFFKESEIEVRSNFANKLPDTANYFEHPERLLYNPKRKLFPNYDHTLNDNKDRWISKLGQMSDAEIRQKLLGSIKEVETQVRNNYKIAIPQYFGGRMQLLLPLRIESAGKSDLLALVVEEEGEGASKNYVARTCLTLAMAYNNARLIVQPLSDWLTP